MIKRREDWMARLMCAVETAQVLPFTYGLHDCCTFAAHCVDAMCDSELLRKMQRTHPYSLEEDAYELIETHGGLARLVSFYLGEPMDNPRFAGPGDVVLVEDDGRELVGVVIGHSVVAPGATHLLSWPLDHVRRAWTV